MSGGEIRYRRPGGVEPGRADRPVLSTGRGGFVAVDDRLLELWALAHGRSLAEVLAGLPGDEAERRTARAALACLAEAGLLERDPPPPAKPAAPGAGGALVSAVIPITSEKERDWLGDCVESLFAQTHESIEVIVVDNATDFGLPEWLAARHPRALRLRLPGRSPFAVALNRGVAEARGAHLLLLNPDLVLDREAVANLVRVAEADPRCAAVAAKLKFLWAPSFLNGLGNRVRDFSWGTDNAIGHLDLGQFDHWEEVPSACFAAALVPRPAWEAVGPVDESFQLYFEDAEWCYRARLLGHTIRVAPKAEVLHYFGGWVREPGKTAGLTPWKIRHAVYGRLRFAARIVGEENLGRFRRNYLREDRSNLRAALRGRRFEEALAYLRGWGKYARHSPRLRRERRDLQARRLVGDAALFPDETTMPRLLVWRDLPELTWPIVEADYLPLILEGRTRPLPEFPRP
jgi:GT2 family glycosyltransferase